jgi:hypothetical protein
MEIVENWSRIVGTVQECQASADPDGPALVVIRVDEVSAVARGGDAYRNLLTDTKGEVVRVQVPGVDARDLNLARGTCIEVEVRRGRRADKLFARPGTMVLAR